MLRSLYAPLANGLVFLWPINLIIHSHNCHNSIQNFDRSYTGYQAHPRTRTKHELEAIHTQMTQKPKLRAEVKRTQMTQKPKLRECASVAQTKRKCGVIREGQRNWPKISQKLQKARQLYG